MLNLGLRHDFQSHLDDAANVSPRLGFTWTPFGARRSVVRVSAGRYYQVPRRVTLRADAPRWTASATPSDHLESRYPDPVSQGVPLAQRPSSIIRLGPDLRMPSTWRLSVALDQPVTSWARVRTTPTPAGRDATCSAVATRTRRPTASVRTRRRGRITQSNRPPGPGVNRWRPGSPSRTSRRGSPATSPTRLARRWTTPRARSPCRPTARDLSGRVGAVAPGHPSPPPGLGQHHPVGGVPDSMRTSARNQGRPTPSRRGSTRTVTASTTIGPPASDGTARVAPRARTWT